MSSRTWITRFSRILADKRLRPILAAACLLPFAFGAARAADPPEVDENLPARQDSTVLRQVTYSFHERFHYDLSTDSTLYGTVEHFKSLYPESYWTEQLGKLTNDDGTLARLVRQDMLALVVIYDLTGDPL
jgi:hypothetical protein